MKFKPIETIWHGTRFRSRLEARWAIVFECMNIDWEYEPQGFEMNDGTWYLPDFLLRGVCGDGYESLWVEVKGEWDSSDRNKVKEFTKGQPLYIVGNIPIGKSWDFPDGDMFWYRDMDEASTKGSWPRFFNYETVDGRVEGAFLGVGTDGRARLLSETECQHGSMAYPTALAYKIASMARFEHGECPDEHAIQECQEAILHPKGTDSKHCRGHKVLWAPGVPKELVEEVVIKSEARTWNDAKCEWFVSNMIDDQECGGECVCGKEDLRYLFEITNRNNGNVIFPIGSSCIEHFGVKDMELEARRLKAINRLINAASALGKGKILDFFANKSLFSRDLIGYMYDQYVYDDNDYDFLRDMFNMRRRPTMRQERRCHSIMRRRIYPYLRKVFIKQRDIEQVVQT